MKYQKNQDNHNQLKMLFLQRINHFSRLYKQIYLQMSEETTNKKIRIFSARIGSSTDCVRPLSGISTQTFSRKQLIQNVYTSQTNASARVLSARQISGRIQTAIQAQNQKPVRKQSAKPTRQKQEMAEQIRNLKQTINRMVEESAQQKNKLQSMRKKSSKYSKILSMQFQNERQWGSHTVSNHLVVGIKNKYDDLKQRYQLKCKEFEELLTKPNKTKEMQQTVLLEILQNENKHLSQLLGKQHGKSGLMYVSNQIEKQANEFVRGESEQDYKKLVLRFKQVEAKYKLSSTALTDSTNKVMFLQKLIIQKDNNVHAAHKKLKNITQQNAQLKLELHTVREELTALQERYASQKLAIQYVMQEAEKTQIADLEELKKRSNDKISKLEKDNDYLEEMIKQLRTTNTEITQECQRLKEKKVNNSVHVDKFSRNQVAQFKLQQKNKKEENSVIYHEVNAALSQKRMPRKADKRCSEQAVKKTPVYVKDVEGIAELLRLKMIGQRLSIQTVKQCFSVNSQEKYVESTWNEQYISMHQAYQILISKPFNLIQEDALLLSRYLIQDVKTEHVYCDNDNENNRQIVKSIVKTLLGDYQTDISGQLQSQCTLLINRYGKKLKQTLISLSPNHTISKQRFAQVVKSIGIDLSSNALQWLLGKISVDRCRIDSLPYMCLF